jgi:hypothetical protein
MTPCVDREDVTPVCPHCSQGLKEVWCRGLSSAFGRRYVYFWPHGRKVLGLSHRKGFWMG